jgi:hypothetical protein
MIKKIVSLQHAACISLLMIFLCASSHAQTPPTNNPPVYGPFNAAFLADGDGLKKLLVKEDTVLHADSPWSLYGWVQCAEAPAAPTLVAGIGDPEREY